MTITKLKKAIDVLEVTPNQLATLLDKNPLSIQNYLNGKTKIVKTIELSIEALIQRKLDDRLWKDMSTK
jgi:hypothetical protein